MIGSIGSKLAQPADLPVPGFSVQVWEKGTASMKLKRESFGGRVLRPYVPEILGPCECEVISFGGAVVEKG